MGWPWTSKSTNLTTTTEPLSPPSSISPPASDPQLDPSSPPLPSEKDEEAHLLAYLESLASSPAEPTSPPSPTPLSVLRTLASISSPPPPPPPPSSSSSSDPNQDPQRLTLMNIHPRSLSCQTAFDTAFRCQSMRGRLTSHYRYGHQRSCSDVWSQFWFCIKVNYRPMSQEERERRIVQNAAERERKYRTGPSSQDVWKQREFLLSGAFEGNLEEMERRYENLFGVGMWRRTKGR